ncbi:hypothetical protein ACJX0J_008517, partial [Zea mays]
FNFIYVFLHAIVGALTGLYTLGIRDYTQQIYRDLVRKYIIPYVHYLTGGAFFSKIKCVWSVLMPFDLVGWIKYYYEMYMTHTWTYPILLLPKKYSSDITL